MPAPTVLAVSRSATHSMSKPTFAAISLVAGLGLAEDAHSGVTVQHLSRVRRDPTMPNLRQVHLIHHELIAELAAAGFAVVPGLLGENVTTTGLPLLELPTGTRLTLGPQVVIELTGLRNPCHQIDGLQAGLLKAVLHRAADGSLIRRAGVMAVVLAGGRVVPGDPIVVELPDGPHRPLVPV